MSRAKKRRNKKLAEKATKTSKLVEASPAPTEQTLTIQQAIDLGVQHHSAGDLAKAESIYQQILVAEPNQPVALNLLGLIAHQFGKNDIAVDLSGKALAINPDYAEAHYNLGNALKDMGKLDDAAASYNKALSINPDYAEAHSNLGFALNEQGKLDDAVASYRKALAINPDYAEVHNNIGLVLNEKGKLDDAVASYNKSLVIKPDFSEAHYNLGNALKDMGKLDDAAASYNKSLVIKPDFSEAHYNLGNALKDMGKLDDAVISFSKALAINPDYAEAHSNLGLIHLENGCLGDAEKCFHTSLELKPDDDKVIANLGHVLLMQGRPEKSLECYRKALKLNPNNINAHIALANGFNSLVPIWHPAMMNDDVRNDAYLVALKTAITADTYVLEIGTGSGLLAMMAARSGAEKVTTCEVSSTIAATAQEIIATNGMSGTIDVIAKKSTNVEVGVDMPRPADLLVSEVFSNELLGEGVLHSVEDAKRRLLSPEARIIPCGGSIMIALFGGGHIGKNIMVGDVSGFDMRKFNSITSKKRFFSASDWDVELLTDDFEVFNFDFYGDNYFPPEQKTLRVPIVTAGKCFGIIQWIRFQLDDTAVFENHPFFRTQASGWRHVAYVFDEPINIERNQTAIVSAMHDRNAPWFTLESIE